MNNPSQTSGMIRADLLAALAGSSLILLYLFIQVFQPNTAGCAESQTDPSLTALREKIAHLEEESKPAAQAPWIQERMPVPDGVLYPYHEDPKHWAPEPEAPAKQRSWLNTMLFPTVRCPYCGRRVPTKKGSYIFLIIGFLGQIGFTSRFLVQWIASERARSSVIPEAFWWLSIFGSILLLTYSISILAWPIILGQTPNIFIYSRNLYFIHRQRNAAAASTEAP